MLVDVSHISDKGFWDVAEIAREKGFPFAATHSNSRFICSHPRNLDDDMLNEIASSGGFTGMNVYSCFLDNGCKAGMDEVIKHIEYICEKAGAGTVGIGTDFDGINRKKSALDGPGDIPALLERLLQLNYSESDVKGIAAGNILRTLNRVLP